MLAFGLWLTANLGALAYAAGCGAVPHWRRALRRWRSCWCLCCAFAAWARTDARRLRRLRRGLAAAAAAAVLGVHCPLRMGGGLDPDQLLMTNPGDSIWTFSLGYICRNLPATAKLCCVRSPNRGALWLQGVLGTTLGEPIVYRLDVSWLLGVGLVLALLAAALPAQGEQPPLAHHAAHGARRASSSALWRRPLSCAELDPINYQTLWVCRAATGCLCCRWRWCSASARAISACGACCFRRAALAVTACTLLTLLQGFWPVRQLAAGIIKR